MNLSELKKNFEKFGFCKIDKFFNRQTVQKIKNFSKDIKKNKPKPHQIMKYYENSIIDKKKKKF